MFSHAKGPFLEFLRNLTPQSLLLSIALIMGSKLNLARFDFGNTMGTLPFILSMLTFFAAAIANISMLIEGLCRSISDIDSKLKCSNLKGVKWQREAIRLLYEKKKTLFYELLVVVLVVQVGCFVVLYSSMQAAIKFYFNIHGCR
ncbi:MAG: hypothetical protein GJU77_05165 [Ferrovum sp.]|jgi:hypothetical protein|nr:hypothetical protein [Ferrovum sp.]NDU88521.1 hypothetical protein [Ferrovum sp.]